MFIYESRSWNEGIWKYFNYLWLNDQYNSETCKLNILK